jgi:hypothetical protein
MFAWRDYLEVHPAADDYPLLKDGDPAAFRELVEDNRRHGLRANIVFWVADDGKRCLLDGRNRLDALAELGVLYDIDGELGLKSWTGTKWAELSGCALSVAYQVVLDGNPDALAASLNLHRRHLTAEQKRIRVAKLLRASPAASNNAIAKRGKVDDKTVATVRRKMEARSEIPNVEIRTDTKGRSQPAKKVRVAKEGTTSIEPSAERRYGKAALVFEEVIAQIGRAQRMADALHELLASMIYQTITEGGYLPAFMRRSRRARDRRSSQGARH